jgi:hypothetical protein
VAASESKARWSVERRLEFIDFRLYWEGRINRGDLVDFFGISVPQASADFSRYQESAPANFVYDMTLKTYVAGAGFRPTFFIPSAEQYLAQYRLRAAGILTEGESWVARLPAYSVVPLPRRRLEPQTLRRILEAIRSKASIEISYQSFSCPEPNWRWISPHALGFDGFRWHARAWCHTHTDFRDFVLARVLRIRAVKPADIDPARDAGWQREVTLKLGPHPEMSAGARRAIELDYGMIDGVVEIRTRACLSYYLERQLGLDLDPAKLPPGRQQIVLLNRQEVEAVQGIAKNTRCRE